MCTALLPPRVKPITVNKIYHILLFNLHALLNIFIKIFKVLGPNDLNSLMRIYVSRTFK